MLMMSAVAPIAAMRLEKLEDELVQSLGYQAAIGDTEPLKALEFYNGINDHDEFDGSSGFHNFGVGKAKHGDGMVCGMHMPGIERPQPNNSQCSLHCGTAHIGRRLSPRRMAKCCTIS